MALDAAAFSDEWVNQLVAVTADRAGVPGVSGVVGLGTEKSPQVVLQFQEGKVAGPSQAEPEVVIPITQLQLDAWTRGELSLSVAYMKGDVKPVGSSGALLAALEVLDSLQLKG